MLNPVIESIVQTILATPRACQFNLNMTIKSEADSTFSLVMDFVDALTIDQSFVANYRDVVTVNARISPADYARIYDVYTGLTATLIFTFVDAHGDVTNSVTPIIKKYRCTIDNLQDVRKRITAADHRREPDMQIVFHLIDYDVYDLMKAQVGGMTYTSTTIDNAIRHAFAVMGVTKLDMTTIDNTHTYDHILIPPYKAFDKLLPYFQATYGCYAGGINFYFTGGILYVYPPYDTSPDTNSPIKIYQTGQGEYVARWAHSYKNGMLSLISNVYPQITDYTISGSEEHGTAVMFTRSSKIVDGAVKVDPNTGPSYTEDPALIVRLKNSRQVAPNYNKVVYSRTSDNVFPSMSKLIASQCVIVNTVWGHALPYSIAPGAPVNYIHDSVGKVITQTGRVDKIVYHYRRTSQAGAGYIYSGEAHYALRLRPDTLGDASTLSTSS